MPPYNRPCLTLVRESEVVTVSWVQCLRNLYDLHDPGKCRRQRVIQAFRLEAFDTPSMTEARAKYQTGKCAGCDKRCKLHIDHDGKPFAQILDEFVEHKKLKLDKISVNYTAKPYMLLSRTLAAQWRVWHDEHAELLGLCRKCNSAKGSGGYRHKK